MSNTSQFIGELGAKHLLSKIKKLENTPAISSWNDLTDKPFYEDEKENVLFDQVVSLSSSGSFASDDVPFEIKIDETYLVTFDGTEYECVGKQVKNVLGDTPSTTFMIGNSVILNNGDGVDTEEPFLLCYSFANEVTSYFQIMTKDYKNYQDSDVAITVKEKISEIHYLDPKYIKDMYYTEGGGEITELPIEGEWMDNGQDYDDDGIIDEGDHEWTFMFTAPIGLQAGNEYTVNWDGTDYTCVGQDALALTGEIPGVVIGSFSEVAIEPFIILEIPSEYVDMMGAYGMAMDRENKGNISFSIKGKSVEKIHKMPNKYLDLAWIPESKKGKILIENCSIESYKRIKYNASDFYSGQKINVIFDGKEYTCTVSGDAADGYIFGNMAIITGSIGGGEPFLFYGGTVVITDSESHTMMVYDANQDGTFYVKLPTEYLPKHEHDIATKDKDGFFSKTDKNKLDGIESNANKTVVDTVISETSTNPLANKSVKAALDKKPGIKVEGNIYTVDEVEVTAESGAEIFNNNSNIAVGQYSHAEGHNTKALKFASHAEGSFTTASSLYAHAEGRNTTASGNDSHAEGYYTTASGSSAHAEGSNTTASGSSAHAEGYYTTASGEYAHTEGWNTTALGNAAHAEGYYTTASGEYAHAEGDNTISSGRSSHTEGYKTTASGNYSHAEGHNTTASGAYSHAEGWNTTASGDSSHAEGYETTALDAYSHAEGRSTIIKSNYSHVQGRFNINYNYIEEIGIIDNLRIRNKEHYISDGYTLDGNTGLYTLINPEFTMIPHIANKFIAEENPSKSMFKFTNVVSTEGNEYVEGPAERYDRKVEKEYAHIVGNGINDTQRSNAHTLDWEGNAWFAGKVYIGGTSQDNAKELLTKDNINIINGSKSGSLRTVGSLEESDTYTIGQNAFAIGQNTEASGYCAHAEGYGTKASGSSAHAEGQNTTASGVAAHAEGWNTTALGNYSHAEGYGTKASESRAHAEGSTTTASGQYAHAEGAGTTASDYGAHAEGQDTVASGTYAHAEGCYTTASGGNAHAEGYNTTASSADSHAEGYFATASGNAAHAEGYYTTASGEYAHAEGRRTTASGNAAHAEGQNTTALGNYSHAEGQGTKASGEFSHAEGFETESSGEHSHAEGQGTEASGEASHTEGYNTTALGDYAHAEGSNTTALGYYSHTEGYNTTALGDYSHAEGSNTVSFGKYSHVQGKYNKIYKYIENIEESISHSKAVNTIAYIADNYTFDENTGLYTLIDPVQVNTLPHDIVNKYVSDYGITVSDSVVTCKEMIKFITVTSVDGDKYVVGSTLYYTSKPEKDYVHIVGNGNFDTERSNAHTLDWNGVAWYQGDIYTGGTSQDDENAKKLATEEFVENLILGAIGGGY